MNFKRSEMNTILIVDDEKRMRDSLNEILSNEGYTILLADGAASAVEQIRENSPDVALVDVRMPEKGGLELLQELRSIAPCLPVIMMTGFPSVETAVLAMKFGAMDFFTKPLDLAKLRGHLSRILNAKSLSEQIHPTTGLERMLGVSPAISKLRDDIRRVAPTDASIIISGESGTGKELVAEAIHSISLRSAFPYMKINCAAIPENLLESELFGYEKGAFTGASAKKPGLFESAQNGTVFLDEIGDMDLRLQAKLLRVLQDGEFRRVGGTQNLKSNVRIIAASNKDLHRLIQDGSFREDLYYRLSVISLLSPPLRERIEDIPILARSFVSEFSRCYGKEEPSINNDFLQILGAQRWTGNVRELKNCIERAVIFCDGSILGPEHIPSQYRMHDPVVIQREAPEDAVPMSETIGDLERKVISDAIDKSGGNRTQAAKLLGIHRRTLYNKLKKLGIDEDN